MTKDRLIKIGAGATTAVTLVSLGINYLIHKNDNPVEVSNLLTNTFENTGVIKYAPDGTIYDVVVDPNGEGADCVIFDESEGQSLKEAKNVLGYDPETQKDSSKITVTESGSIKIICAPLK